MFRLRFVFGIEASSRLISGSLWGVNTVAKVFTKEVSLLLIAFRPARISRGLSSNGGMASLGFFADLIGFQSELLCLLSLFM